MESLDTQTLDETVPTNWDDLSIPQMEPASADSDRRNETNADDPVDPGQRLDKLCLAFRGIGGGVGTTTIAIETAHVLARSERGSVCLVDLDFELGTIANYLDATTQPRIEDLTGDPSRLDAQYIRARLFHHDAGFAVFAATGSLGSNEIVSPECVLAAMDTLAEMFDVLVLDVPRLHRSWTQAALVASETVCLVGELTIPSLHVCRQRTEDIMSLGAKRVEVILSKTERRSFRASLRASDAERALGKPLLGTVSADPHAAHDALNCAVPVGQAARDSRLSKDIGSVARALSPWFAERRRQSRRKR